MEKEIADYLRYLEEHCGLIPSLHGNSELFAALFKDPNGPILPFHAHNHPYCLYVKGHCGQRKCRYCQILALEKARFHSFFFGVCHAGVGEWIFGIRFRGETVGFVSVSGYATHRSDSANPGHSYLKTIRPDPETVHTLIFPLTVMLEAYLEHCLQKDSEGGLYRELISYLQENHQGISLKELSSVFHYSASHISHLFRKNSGVTLREYCNRLKVEDACRLLKNTSLSVTEIAQSVGFSNLSYFVEQFRLKKGVTPLRYRKQNRRQHF